VAAVGVVKWSGPLGKRVVGKRPGGLGSEERDGETAGRQAAVARQPSRRQAMGERERERERATGERERAVGVCAGRS
jgi:hypothetical protein